MADFEKNKTRAQRSGSRFERRSDGMNERRRLLRKRKRRRERYEVRDDVVPVTGIEPVRESPHMGF